jgi:hypothetical protein
MNVHAVNSNLGLAVERNIQPFRIPSPCGCGV